ncbi:MAG: hypothetical protein GF315_12575 [candidate division Zixibacteria bacterium]|nr:hypothetical protein [candidate division Zixibacteria bacterium]
MVGEFTSFVEAILYALYVMEGGDGDFFDLHDIIERVEVPKDVAKIYRSRAIDYLYSEDLLEENEDNSDEVRLSGAGLIKIEHILEEREFWEELEDAAELDEDWDENPFEK